MAAIHSHSLFTGTSKAAMSSQPAQKITRRYHANLSFTPDGNWDATKTAAPVELLQKSFELAYFLIPDRHVAIEILFCALEKLRVLSRRENKRLYWRDKHAERPVRRIVRNDTDM